MRALITGAAGMYGFNLTRRLLGDDPGASVVAVDDFSRHFPGGEPLTPEAEAGKGHRDRAPRLRRPDNG